MTKTIYKNEYIKTVEAIKKARVEAGLTQKEVSVKIKKPQSYISKVERGEQRIDIVELKILADLYKKKIDYFIK